MGYATLAQCVSDLEAHGDLIRIDAPIDPRLELPYVQRQAFRNRAPALLFTNPKGCRFPMLANLFGTRERVNFIFRDAIGRARTILEAAANPRGMFARPAEALGCLPALWHMRARWGAATGAPVLAHACPLGELPQLVGWPGDGGAFITLPLALSEDPDQPGSFNLGMYRVQLGGNDYGDNEVGLHYQLQRGIGIHHARALARGVELPVSVHVGGPPALAISAVVPLPEGMNELLFAGILGGRRMRLVRAGEHPVLAQADFVVLGRLGRRALPEGPFGDHLGYYSLRHDFPVLTVERVCHRPEAIWPFTSVGRPPQEDTVFGDFIHELTAPLVSHVFGGVKAVHAVDAAGVHPLLLAIGSERYTAYEAIRRPREMITQAMHLLGATQTALAKFVLMVAAEDAPGLDCRDVGAFLRHLLLRTDFSADLRFIGRTACDSLDYSGYGLHEGSRLIWTAAGEVRRALGDEIRELPDLPAGFGNPRLAMPGVLLLAGPPHKGHPLSQDRRMANVVAALANWPHREEFPLVAVVDDSGFASASLENFLWSVFTRADPARDCYGVGERSSLKHWSCDAPLIIDGRLKEFQAPPLEDDAGVVRRMRALAARGGPLAGLI